MLHKILNAPLNETLKLNVKQQLQNNMLIYIYLLLGEL